MKQFRSGEAQFIFKEKKYQDGSITRTVRVKPITIADRIYNWLRVFFILALIYIVVYAFIQLLRDIDSQIEIEKHIIRSRKVSCEQEFILNDCTANITLQSMKEHCLQLEHCTLVDDDHTVRSKQIWIKVIGMTLENMLMEISYKSVAIIAIVITIFGIMVFKK